MLNKLIIQATNDHKNDSFFNKCVNAKVSDIENKMYSVDVYYGNSYVGVGVYTKVYSYLPVNDCFVKIKK